MEVSKDVLMKLALDLDYNSILNLCRTEKRANEIICKSQTFWRNKLKKEYPMLDVTKIKDPRNVFRKIIEAKSNPQRSYNSYFHNGHIFFLF